MWTANCLHQMAFYFHVFAPYLQHNHVLQFGLFVLISWRFFLYAPWFPAPCIEWLDFACECIIWESTFLGRFFHHFYEHAPIDLTHGIDYVVFPPHNHLFTTFWHVCDSLTSNFRFLLEIKNRKLNCYAIQSGHSSHNKSVRSQY